LPGLPEAAGRRARQGNKAGAIRPDNSEQVIMKAFPPVLLQGYQSFLADFAAKPQFYRRLAEEGQKPEIMIIGCCDSRASPEIIFNMGPGDIFVTRNIANQVPPYQPDGHFHATSAALEYAVKTLQVKHIIVLGHGHCGGIAAVLAGAAASGEIAPGDSRGKPCSCPAPGYNAAAAAALQEAAPPHYDFIGDWLQLLKPAVEAVAANALMTQYERQQELERISLRFSIKNLRSFPWIKAAEERGALALHAAWFDIASAELWLLDEAKGAFTLSPPVDTAEQGE